MTYRATSHTADLAALDAVSQLLADTLAVIDDEQQLLPTPCDDWNLVDLIDHITGGNWFTIQIIDGHTAADAMEQAMQRFAKGSATRHAAVESVHDQLTAFRAPGVVDRSHDHLVGATTGHVILCLRLHDLIVHTWDIANTIGPPWSLPDDLIQWAATELADEHSQTAQHFQLAPDETPPLGNSQIAYLGRFGRKPPSKGSR